MGPGVGTLLLLLRGEKHQLHFIICWKHTKRKDAKVEVMLMKKTFFNSSQTKEGTVQEVEYVFEIGHYSTSFPLSSFHSLFPPSPH